MKLFVGLTSSRSVRMVSLGCFFRRNIQNTRAILEECEVQVFEDLEGTFVSMTLSPSASAV